MSNENPAEEERGLGASTPPGETYLDKQQGGPSEGGEESVERNTQNVELDKDAVDLLDPEGVEEPKQVEDVHVIFVPHKDFEARVNKDTFYFRKDIPTQVTRDIANMLLEDRTRGYVK